jgi:hypothetical protein
MNMMQYFFSNDGSFNLLGGGEGVLRCEIMRYAVRSAASSKFNEQVCLKSCDKELYKIH